MWGYSLKLRLSLPSEKEAAVISEAISPELGAAFEKRSSTRVNINKNVLSLAISAADINALKASLNNYMKLVVLVSEFMD